MSNWVMRVYRGICVGISLVLGTACGPGRADDQKVLSWAIKQNIPKGQTKEAALPEPLKKASVEKRVIIAHLADGRTCILLKKQIGWKNNFDASLCCNRPLRTEEVVTDENSSRHYISLSGHGPFEELYIRHKRDERTFDVYFDLN